MDRTVKYNDDWLFFENPKKPKKAKPKSKKNVSLPQKSETSFALSRKIICPKQVNDTVSVFFEGNFKNLRVFCNKKLVFFEKDEQNREIYDITPALKYGSTNLCAFFDGGEVDGFFLSIKRKSE